MSIVEFIFTLFLGILIGVAISAFAIAIVNSKG